VYQDCTKQIIRGDEWGMSVGGGGGMSVGGGVGG
jgi:hypothetical protein